jgi:hypothetical protein
MLKGTFRLIDSVWTVTYKMLDNGKAEIISYNRDDAEGYEKEGKLPFIDVVENGARIVTHLSFRDGRSVTSKEINRIEVANPAHVFHY